MLLIPAVTLTALGLAVWMIGEASGYQEVSVIGAVLVLGVGGVVVTGGLEQQSGTIEKTINSSTTEQIPQRSPVELAPQVPTGALWMLLGGMLTLRPLNRV